MFEQIEGAVRGGMAEHAQNAQHAGAAANGALASTLQVGGLWLSLSGCLSENGRSKCNGSTLAFDPN